MMTREELLSVLAEAGYDASEAESLSQEQLWKAYNQALLLAAMNLRYQAYQRQQVQGQLKEEPQCA